MTSKQIWWGILAFVLVFAGGVIGCDTGSDDKKPQKVEYRGQDVSGNTYILTVTEKAGRAAYTPAEGDSYVLIIKFTGQPDKKSSGTVKEISADGTLTLQPSVEGSGTFSVVISGSEINSVVGNIAVEGGGVVTPRSFDTIYLRAKRWDNRTPTGNQHYGEYWTSGNSIRLSDFIDETPQKGEVYRFKMSGTADTEMKYIDIDLLEVRTGREWEWLGAANTKTLISGDFDCIISVTITNDVDDPDNDIVGQIVNKLWQKDASKKDEIGNDSIIFNNGETIPENIPDDTIMATISNFKISLVNTEEGDWRSWGEASFSVGADDIVTVTILRDGGLNSVGGVQKPYIGIKNAYYKYSFDAWTESGNRTVAVGYGEERDGDYIWYPNTPTEITPIRTTYELRRDISDTLDCYMFFNSGDAGTFYVKINSIGPLD